MIDTHGFRQQTDPAADALVATLYEKYGHKAATDIYLKFVHTIGPIDYDTLPAEIGDFYDQELANFRIDEPEKIRRAYDLFVDMGHGMSLLLVCRSLPMLYSGGNGVQVLYSTGYLMGKNQNQLVARRLAETAQFIIDVMQRNAWEENGPGRYSTLKVRIIHAYVRAFLWNRNWDVVRYGQPVNQEDMAGTLMGFSVCVVEGLVKLGFKLSPADKDAIIYTWHCIGKLMGVADELNPPDYISAYKIFEAILYKERRYTRESAALTQALLDFLRELMTPEAVKNTPLHKTFIMPEVLVNFLVGRDIAPFIGRREYDHTLQALAIDTFGTLYPSYVRFSRSSAITKWPAEQFAGFLISGIVDHLKNKYNTSLNIPPELVKGWSIHTLLKNGRQKVAAT